VIKNPDGAKVLKFVNGINGWIQWFNRCDLLAPKRVSAIKKCTGNIEAIRKEMRMAHHGDGDQIWSLPAG